MGNGNVQVVLMRTTVTVLGKNVLVYLDVENVNCTNILSAYQQKVYVTLHKTVV